MIKGRATRLLRDDSRYCGLRRVEYFVYQFFFRPLRSIMTSDIDQTRGDEE